MWINNLLSILMFVSFIGLILTGFPVAWVLGGLAVLFTAIAIVLEIDLGLATGVDWAYTSISVNRVWDVMKNWVLVALPLFIFMGLMLERSGIANDLMTNLTRVFGRVRGGLAVAVTPAADPDRDARSGISRAMVMDISPTTLCEMSGSTDTPSPAAAWAKRSR